MEEIINHNCCSICSEELCDNIETHFIRIKVNDLYILIGFCEKHAKMYEERVLGIIGGVQNE